MEKQTGLVHLYHGDGKGKTSSAVGLCVRASGNGLKCLWTSFLKDYQSGEFFGNPPFTLYRGEPVSQFVFMMNDKQKKKVTEEHTARIQTLFQMAQEEPFDLLVLDEVVAACNLELIPYDTLLSLIQNKPAHLELILTGRDPSPELIEIADYVSEIRAVKHPFNDGTIARKGIEF